MPIARCFPYSGGGGTHTPQWGGAARLHWRGRVMPTLAPALLLVALGPPQRCPGLTPGSVLRPHAWRCSGNQMGCEDQTKVGPGLRPWCHLYFFSNFRPFLKAQRPNGPLSSSQPPFLPRGPTLRASLQLGSFWKAADAAQPLRPSGIPSLCPTAPVSTGPCVRPTGVPVSGRFWAAGGARAGEQRPRSSSCSSTPGGSV